MLCYYRSIEVNIKTNIEGTSIDTLVCIDEAGMGWSCEGLGARAGTKKGGNC